MNCINCGQLLPEDKSVFDVPSDAPWKPLSSYEFQFSSDPLEFGLVCSTCKSNAVAIKDLMKRGALDGDDYITMQQERKIVKHLKSHTDCGCDLDGFCDDMRLLLGWKLR